MQYSAKSSMLRTNISLKWICNGQKGDSSSLYAVSDHEVMIRKETQFNLLERYLFFFFFLPIQNMLAQSWDYMSSLLIPSFGVLHVSLNSQQGTYAKETENRRNIQTAIIRLLLNTLTLDRSDGRNTYIRSLYDIRAILELLNLKPISYPLS